MIRLYRRWRKHRREIQALVQIVELLKEHDRAVAKAMAELEALYYEYHAHEEVPTSPN